MAADKPIERARSDITVRTEMIENLLRRATEQFSNTMRPLPPGVIIIMEEKHQSKLQDLQRILRIFSEAWNMANKIGDKGLITTAACGYHKVNDTIKWIRYGLVEEKRSDVSGVPLYS
ncbi:MAG: hypothetical protein M1504_04350 [Candidatus Marsarchaeota archaeon]|nr:hypothetical protein [Candidatus Marsarchaeota archaeon]